jgi:uncharacterized protein YjiS (DUF1127 family)
MRLLHGGIAGPGIVQSQQSDHVCPDAKTGTGSGRRPTEESEAMMAYVNSSRQATVSFGDLIAALVKVIGQSMQRRRVYLQTLNELNALSDRDLSDLGLARSDIPYVAREAAYGA